MVRLVSPSKLETWVRLPSGAKKEKLALAGFSFLSSPDGSRTGASADQGEEKRPWMAAKASTPARSDAGTMPASGGSTPIWRLNKARLPAGLCILGYGRQMGVERVERAPRMRRRGARDGAESAQPRPVAMPTGCRRAKGRLPSGANLQARLFGGSLHFKATAPDGSRTKEPSRAGEREAQGAARDSQRRGGCGG